MLATQLLGNTDASVDVGSYCQVAFSKSFETGKIFVACCLPKPKYKQNLLRSGLTTSNSNIVKLTTAECFATRSQPAASTSRIPEKSAVCPRRLHLAAGILNAHDATLEILGCEDMVEDGRAGEGEPCQKNAVAARPVASRLEPPPFLR